MKLSLKFGIVSVCIFASTFPASLKAQTVYIDQPTTINSTISSPIVVGSINPNPFEVDLVNGGNVTGEITLYNQSSLKRSGGEIDGDVFLRENSSMVMTGGTDFDGRVLNPTWYTRFLIISQCL